MKIKKKDFVKVITGKYKGKIGEVLKTFPNKNKIIVENVNIFKRHKKANGKNLTGTIEEYNSPIDVSNVVFYDKEKKETCKIGYKFFDGEKWRINKKTSEKIDIIKKGKIKNGDKESK